MKEAAIKVEGLSKKYVINKAADTLVGSFDKLFSRREKEEFWALDDVSFAVEKGESLGIIGRNGAGKSTLLKILSRITPPTKGTATIHGRVSSLLEVGTGFHPELTGRENVFLNGALLGMGRAEIRSKLDEIIAFSGIEKFIDTPVKKYSSGMYVRLAFSVAAHLDSDVLIVDEVLSVGDRAFRKKCITKMETLNRTTGKTVLFVSHNLGVVTELCKNCMLLESGKIKKIGATNDVISKYLNQKPSNEAVLENSAARNDRIAISDIYILKDQERVQYVNTGDELEVILKYKTIQSLHSILLKIEIADKNGKLISIVNSKHVADRFIFDGKKGTVSCKIKKLPLNAGEYKLFFHIKEDLETIFQSKGFLKLEVGQGSFYKSGMLPSNKATLLLEHSWTHNKNENK